MSVYRENKVIRGTEQVIFRHFLQGAWPEFKSFLNTQFFSLALSASGIMTSVWLFYLLYCFKGIMLFDVCQFVVLTSNPVVLFFSVLFLLLFYWETTLIAILHTESSCEYEHVDFQFIVFKNNKIDSKKYKILITCRDLPII